MYSLPHPPHSPHPGNPWVLDLQWPWAFLCFEDDWPGRTKEHREGYRCWKEMSSNLSTWHPLTKLAGTTTGCFLCTGPCDQMTCAEAGKEGCHHALEGSSRQTIEWEPTITQMSRKQTGNTQTFTPQEPLPHLRRREVSPMALGGKEMWIPLSCSPSSPW